MASGNYYDDTSSYANFRLILNLSSTANISANTSTVSYDCYIQVIKNVSNYRYNTGNSASFTLNGETILNTGNIGAIQCNNTPVGTRVVTLASGSRTIAHGSDGKKSISFSATFRQTQSWGDPLTISGTFTLDNIARTSNPSVSSSSVTVGNNITIYTNRASNSFGHNLQYKIGNGSYTTFATGVTTSYTWTVPTSIANSITTSNSAAITINCQTYNGSTYIGSSTCSFTANVPSYNVTAPTISISDGKNILSGFYLQRLSTIKVAITAPTSSQYGASISSRSIKITPPSGSASSYNSSPAESGILDRSGVWTISATVTDSRGKTSSATTQTINCTAYNMPVISDVGLIRTDDTGDPQFDGDSMNLTFKYNVTSIKDGSTEKNTCNATWQYKEADASSYGTATTVGTVVGTATTYTGVIATGELSADIAYNVLLTLTDKFRSVTYAVNLATSMIPIDLNQDGTAMGLFSPADISGTIHIGTPIAINTADGEAVTFRPVIVSTW